MTDTDDWMLRLRDHADRFREAADQTPPVESQSKPQSNHKPSTIKRPYSTPSGATARSVKAKNAYQRVQRKRG